MANNPNPDRDSEYMYKMWGTTNLITDYWSLPKDQKEEKMLREIANDDMTPKKTDETRKTDLFLGENVKNESK